LVPVPDEESTKVRFAQPQGLLKDRIEHWREVAGRGVDNLQDLGTRGLLCNRFGKFGIALGEPALRFGEFGLTLSEPALQFRDVGVSLGEPALQFRILAL
jgi:hypothetical protein